VVLLALAANFCCDVQDMWRSSWELAARRRTRPDGGKKAMRYRCPRQPVTVNPRGLERA
jgi:hypothetical protein